MDYFIHIHSHKTRFILSLISAILYQMSSSIVTTLGNFCVYFISYIHYKNPDEKINMQYGNINGPIILLLLSSFSPLSGIMEKKFGPKITLLLSSLIVELCLIFYFFQKNLYLFYTISIIIGFGNGLSAGVPIKNACKYYPKKKGTINSIIICFGGLVGSLYSFIGEKIINPNKEGIINKETNPFYPDNVANNANKYFLFSLIIFPIITFLSLILFYTFIQNKEEKNNTNLIENNKDNDKSTNTKEIIKTFRFWRNILIIALMPFWAYFLNATYRAYSPMIGINKNLVSYLSTIITGLSGLTGLIWAFIFDKFGFQIIIKIMSSICIILSIYFFIFINNSTFYFIGLLINTTISRLGMMSIINPHIMQVFEFRNYLIIGGFARLFNQLSAFLAALTSVLISLKYKTGEELKTPYRIVSIIGFAFSSVGLILSLKENDEKFIFKNNDDFKRNSLGIESIKESFGKNEELNEENTSENNNKE